MVSTKRRSVSPQQPGFPVEETVRSGDEIHEW